MKDIIERLEGPASGIVRSFDGVKLLWEVCEEDRSAILTALRAGQAAADAVREMHQENVTYGPVTANLLAAYEETPE